MCVFRNNEYKKTKFFYSIINISRILSWTVYINDILTNNSFDLVCNSNF